MDNVDEFDMLLNGLIDKGITTGLILSITVSEGLAVQADETLVDNDWGAVSIYMRL